MNDFLDNLGNNQHQKMLREIANDKLTPKIPDFKVSTVYYQVENGHDRDGLGNDENYFWKTAKERKNEENLPEF